MGQGTGAAEAQAGAAGSPAPAWSCHAACRAGAATRSGAGRHLEPFQLWASQRRAQMSLGRWLRLAREGLWEQEVARWHRLQHSGRGGSQKGVGPCATGRAGVTAGVAWARAVAVRGPATGSSRPPAAPITGLGPRGAGRVKPRGHRGAPSRPGWLLAAGPD